MTYLSLSNSLIVSRIPKNIKGTIRTYATIPKIFLLPISHPYNTPECVTRKYSPFLIGVIFTATHPLRYTKINLIFEHFFIAS